MSEVSLVDGHIDNGMSDEDIIKWLERLHRRILETNFCADVTESEIIALVEVKNIINRQKAEIERLTSQKMSREQDRDYWMAQTRIARDNITFAKSEAIKEFAERLKAESYLNDGVFYIDNLVKEMTESK